MMALLRLRSTHPADLAQFPKTDLSEVPEC
jgi:hypothetical protein